MSVVATRRHRKAAQVMNSEKTGQKQNRNRGVSFGGKRQAESSLSKASDPSFDALSGYALIEALRGSCQGKTSLVAAREREHKRDDRAKSQKLGARDRK
jgi:hypothetical protein